MIAQSIQVGDIGEKHCPCYFRRYVDAVHVHFLIICTVVGAQSNNVSLIRHNKNQLILTKKTQNCRVRLASLVASLNGKCDMLVVPKLKADNRVARKGYSPVGQEEVGGPDL